MTCGCHSVLLVVVFFPLRTAFKEDMLQRRCENKVMLLVLFTRLLFSKNTPSKFFQLIFLAKLDDKLLNANDLLSSKQYNSKSPKKSSRLKYENKEPDLQHVLSASRRSNGSGKQNKTFPRGTHKMHGKNQVLNQVRNVLAWSLGMHRLKTKQSNSAYATAKKTQGAWKKVAIF